MLRLLYRYRPLLTISACLASARGSLSVIYSGASWILIIQFSLLNLTTMSLIRIIIVTTSATVPNSVIKVGDFVFVERNPLIEHFVRHSLFFEHFVFIFIALVVNIKRLVVVFGMLLIKKRWSVSSVGFIVETFFKNRIILEVIL